MPPLPAPGRTMARLLPLLLVLLLACGGRAEPEAARAQAPPVTREGHNLFAELAKRLRPTVVNLQVSKSLPPGHPELPGNEGQGSGVLIDPQGLILTNHHVVSDALAIDVVLHDETRLTGRVLGSDPATDLALVKVQTDRPLPAAKLGTSGTLEVGDWVLAIGNPFGLEATVTVGVLSGTGRVLGSGPYDDYLQTDASINYGNSGGPLFDTRGEVVGINTAILAEGNGLGFAVPIDLAREIVPQLEAKGRVVRGFVGLGIQDLSPRLREAFGVPSEVKGALVSSLVPGGPSARAGVRLQDIVTGFDGRPIPTHRALLRAVAGTRVGQQATLRVFRAGRSLDLRVQVAERPADEDGAPRPSPPAREGLGLRVEPLSPRIARELGTQELAGVVIAQVDPGSPAAHAELFRGDIIRRVGSQPVEDTASFQRALRGVRAPSVAFLVEREGNTTWVALPRE